MWFYYHQQIISIMLDKQQQILKPCYHALQDNSLNECTVMQLKEYGRIFKFVSNSKLWNIFCTMQMTFKKSKISRQYMQNDEIVRRDKKSICVIIQDSQVTNTISAWNKKVNVFIVRNKYVGHWWWLCYNTIKY